jgi:transposase
MFELTSTATCRAFRAVIESVGEGVPEKVLVARTTWLNSLIGQMAAAVVAEHWTAADLDVLASGRSSDGRGLPLKGWMTVRRLGWSAKATDATYSSDRVRRVAEEAAARTLRAAVHHRSIIAAITATWPTDPGRRTEAEWKTLRALTPASVTPAEIRSRTRQVRTYLARYRTLPTDVTDLEAPPATADEALLAAADRQLVTFERVSETTAVLRVQLPLTAAPVTRHDWAFHRITITLPPCVPGDATLCTPSLRVVDHRVRVDVPFKTQVPAAPATGHIVGVGVDWGVNTLLTTTVARLTEGRVASDGRMLVYDVSAVSTKLDRLRRQREALAAKRDQYDRLAGGRTIGNDDQGELRDLRAVVDVEHERVCAKIRHLNSALAWSAARWTVDQAIAAGASVIYIEDLATLEVRGIRRNNARLAGQVRGKAVDAIRHLACRASIAVVTVPARGTSKYCPRCGAGGSLLHHAPAPDRSYERGWKWAICRRCGLSCDRDWAAAERISARGLLGQAHTHTDRTNGHRTIRATVDGNVARARRRRQSTQAIRRASRRGRDKLFRPGSMSKGAPTMKRRNSTNSTSCRMPDRRAVPAPRLWGSVRRDKYPRPSAPWRIGQVLHAIPNTAPASTVSVQLPWCASPLTTGPNESRLRRPECPQ